MSKQWNSTEEIVEKCKGLDINSEDSQEWDQMSGTEWNLEQIEEENRLIALTCNELIESRNYGRPIVKNTSLNNSSDTSCEWYSNFRASELESSVNRSIACNRSALNVNVLRRDWDLQNPKPSSENICERFYSELMNPNPIGFKKPENLGCQSTSNGIVSAILPLIQNTNSELRYGRQEFIRNANMFYSNVRSNVLNDSIWGNGLVPQSIRETNATHVAKQMRNAVNKVEPSYTWSGQLPKKVRNKSPIYSCKLFLGGIPYDLTDSDLHCTFAQYGRISIQWPGKDIKSAIDGATAHRAGYVYIIFDSYDNVTTLLNACTVSYKDGENGYQYFYMVSSRRQKQKEVQIIPFDIGDRFYMKGSFNGQVEHSRTVFVGALHGMLSADGLAKVMDDLFGGVIFTGLDTDKYKYPLGSGRVTFDNQESYMKAVAAAFVEIKSTRFKKKIQIDPYIENESICAVCKVPQQTPIFCRDMSCFRYFCTNCWDKTHSDEEMKNHRPIIKNRII